MSDDLFSAANKAADKASARAQAEGGKSGDKSGENAPQGANVLTVTQLSNQLRFTLEGKFNRVAVEGEISGLKKPASGHVYFTLKDEDSNLNAIVWRSAISRIKAPFEDGTQVVAYGRITTYGPRSNYQIIIDRMEVAGIGALMQRFEALKKKLAAEGLFAPERKKNLPFLPKTVGIITSGTGAVIEDMLNRLRPRYPGHVLLCPVAVQGVGAKEQIAAAIAGFNSLSAQSSVPRPDVLIVARGGGSLEDLWAFNEEVVVRAVAGSDIPVISGVGHEPDVTLCDYAADHRSPTPTAAATESVPDYDELAQKLADLRAGLVSFTKQKIHSHRQQLDGLRRGLPDPQNILNQMRLRLDDRQTRLRQAVAGELRLRRGQFDSLSQRLQPGTLYAFLRQNSRRLTDLQTRLPAALMRDIQHKQKHLESRRQLLRHLSPTAPLEKGFVYVTEGGADKNGSLVKSAHTSATDVTLHFRDGQRRAQLAAKK